MLTQTPLQMLADALAETAQTPQELVSAEIARIRADDLAHAAHIAAQMAQDAVLIRSRTLRGKTVR